MNAFVTSIGEKTTGICCQQLRRFGFKVVLLDKKEEWIDKYKRFIDIADEDCIRVDADIIVNKHIKNVGLEDKKALMISYWGWDFYKNDMGITSPVFYRKPVFDIIKKNLHKIDARRPETSAWRLPGVVEKTFESQIVVGMHGFFQYDWTVKFAKKNKEDRGQISDYDFNLVNNLMNL